MKQRRFERVVVLLDSSTVVGDAGVGFAASLLGADGYMTLAVSISGPEASGLREFADAEEVSISEAAELYLEQVAERLGPYRVNTSTLDGTDLAGDLKAVVDESSADAAVVPASLAARALEHKTLSFPILVVPDELTAP
ncbi:MAG: hypothetical protein OES13_09710 [Acidimicrobiia bacterium]|nr:hypothetical protein [Acidimicrobiia bacterium]